PLGIEPLDRACLLVVDGLGSALLERYGAEAPFLSSLRAPAITAGFPATTAASIASIGTGRPPGEHGLVGYTMGLPGHDRAINALLWETYGVGPKVDLRDTVVPEDLQPEPTAFERAAADGVAVSLVGPVHHEHSGMTRAVLRGGRYRGAFSL